MAFDVENISSVGVKSTELIKQGSEEALKLSRERSAQRKKDFDKAWLEHSAKVEAYNSKFAFFRSRQEMQDLNEQTKALIDYAETYNDPEDIERQNQQWLRTTLARLKEEGGPYSGDLQQIAIEGYILASNEGMRIAEDKLRNEATLELDAYDSRFYQALANGDLGEAMDIKEERDGMINSYVTEGIYTEEEGNVFLKNAKETYANAMVNQLLVNNAFIGASKNRRSAEQDIKQVAKTFKSTIDAADKKTQTLFYKRLNSFKENDTSDILNAQYEYTDTLNSWRLGAATSADVVDESKMYINKLRNAINTGAFERDKEVKAKREIERTQITMKLVEDIAIAGDSLFSGRKVDNPLLDITASVEDVMTHYGFKADSPAAGIIAELKRELPYFKGDSVQTRVSLYNFALGAAGIDVVGDDEATPANLRNKIVRDKRIDRLMGGEGGLTGQSADLFNKMLETPSPDAQAQVADVVIDNPELLRDVAKYRSKPNNSALTMPTRTLLSKYNQILNVSPEDVQGLDVKLAFDPSTKTAYDNIFRFLESAYAEDDKITAFSEYEGVGKQQLFSAVALAIYARKIKELGVSGDADKLIREQTSRLLKRRKDGTYDDSEFTELADFYMKSLTQVQQTRAQVNVTDSSYLQQDTSEANLVISAFSQGTFGIFSKLKNFIDTGGRNIKKLEEVEYAKLTNFVETLLGDKRVDLSGRRLRLMLHSGNMYKLGYINSAGGLNALTDAQGDEIFLNTELLGKFKLGKQSEGDYLIELITRSNIPYGL